MTRREGGQGNGLFENTWGGGGVLRAPTEPGDAVIRV